MRGGYVECLDVVESDIPLHRRKLRVSLSLKTSYLEMMEKSGTMLQLFTYPLSCLNIRNACRNIVFEDDFLIWRLGKTERYRSMNIEICSLRKFNSRHICEDVTRITLCTINFVRL